MKKLKLKESISTLPTETRTSTTDQVIEDLSYVKEPDFNIVDVTVLPDEEYNPTIQSLLINIDEDKSLNESEKLGFNILSETVNTKTGYSSSLFEFETRTKNITLNLSMCESERHVGVWNIKAHTTKGELVFESNTQHPKQVITNYLNSLSSEYLLESEVDEPKTKEATIYQLRSPRDCEYGFLPYKYAEGKLNFDDYDKVATIKLTPTQGLEDIFRIGNTDKSQFDTIKPMRSISVSDIIELGGTKYYVDDFGFKEVA